MAKPAPFPINRFSVVPEYLSALLFANAKPVRLSADEVLFISGDPGDGFYRVDQGLLKVSIVASDRFNIEPITVTGLGIRASSEAALGSINATLGAFSGSLAGGTANVVLPSPGTVVAGQ